MNHYEQKSLDLILYKLTDLDVKFKEFEDKFTELDERLEKIESYLQKQKGFIGGILFVGSCIAWVVSYLKDWWK